MYYNILQLGLQQYVAHGMPLSKLERHVSSWLFSCDAVPKL